MDRDEFHRAYERMPAGFRAELVGGIVFVPSPLRDGHATAHLCLGTVFGTYIAGTPGVAGGDNGTILLGEKGEPQPDLFLRVLPEFGGQTRTPQAGYVEGAPELIAEIAHSSVAIDLHGKREDYARYGVIEYVVFCLHEKHVRWFDLRSGEQLQPDADGIIRSRVIPGLWIDTRAVLANDYARAIHTAQAGLATPEHAAFVADLAARRGNTSS